MTGKTMVPLIDLVFLTLGSILAAMTQMERVEAIPVAVAEVSGAAARLQRGRFDIVTVTADGVTVGDRAVAEEDLADEVALRRVVLRAASGLPTERTLAVLAIVAEAASEVSVEVRGARQAKDGSK